MVTKTTVNRLLVAALFTIAKPCKQPKYSSVVRWVNKLSYLQTMEYYSEPKEMHYQAKKNREEI